MSVTASYTVNCDADDCGEWAGEEGSRQEARRSARDQGFRRKRGVGDVCPVHRDDICGNILHSVRSYCDLKPDHEGDHHWPRTP